MRKEIRGPSSELRIPGHPLVAVLMGSDSDLPVMNEAVEVLRKNGVGCEVKVYSAHRTPELLRAYIVQAEKQGIEVFIAGAGGAAHLPGVIAAYTTLPVIGVPIESQLKGLDSLLSIVAMPRGIPVATMAIGKAGAANAGILALEILRLKYTGLARALANLRRSLKERVIAANQKLGQERSGLGRQVTKSGRRV